MLMAMFKHIEITIKEETSWSKVIVCHCLYIFVGVYFLTTINTVMCYVLSYHGVSDMCSPRYLLGLAKICQCLLCSFLALFDLKWL